MYAASSTCSFGGVITNGVELTEAKYWKGKGVKLLSGHGRVYEGRFVRNWGAGWMKAA